MSIYLPLAPLPLWHIDTIATIFATEKFKLTYHKAVRAQPVTQGSKIRPHIAGSPSRY